MKILLLLIGAAVGAGAGMYYQKKQDEKACPSQLNTSPTITEAVKKVLDPSTATGGESKPSY